MTTITYKTDGISIEGHAEEPVVCHGISAISQMIANYFIDTGGADVIFGDAYVSISGIEQNDGNNALIHAMKTAIKDISNDYPENIIIKELMETE